jgi:hypothetical protein
MNKKRVKTRRNYLSDILYVLKEHLTISKQHKEVTQKQADHSMNIWEQRAWWIISILVVVLLGGGIALKLGAFEKEPIPDYAIKIEVTPSEIKLNENQDVEFKFKFTNVGKKNISEFEISKIELYRFEKDKYVFHRSFLTSSYDRFALACEYTIPGDLAIGKSCSVTKKISSCPECFDDKDKPPQFFIYFETAPPIENRIINLSIY